MRLILIGPPGAGKGTQTTSLSAKYGIAHISTGDMLRAAAKAGSALGIEVGTVLRSGGLVNDSLMVSLVRERLRRHDCVAGFLLDGFPRTIEQADALYIGDVTVDHVLEIQVPFDVIVARISGRLSHRGSGRTYHTPARPTSHRRAGRRDRRAPRAAP